MLYKQRLLWINSPADVDTQINDAKKYIELKRQLLKSAESEHDINECQFLLTVAFETYTKLKTNRALLKQQIRLVLESEKQYA